MVPGRQESSGRRIVSVDRGRTASRSARSLVSWAPPASVMPYSARRPTPFALPGEQDLLLLRGAAVAAGSDHQRLPAAADHACPGIENRAAGSWSLLLLLSRAPEGVRIIADWMPGTWSGLPPLARRRRHREAA